MKIDIVCVGKMKEPFYKAAIKEYLKRLSAFCKIEIMETPDKPIPDHASEKECEGILVREGEALLDKIKKNAWCVALDLNGKCMDSIGFADTLKSCMVSGQSHIVFVIGGSLGLSDGVKDRAQLCLSLSQMTFTHQMTRIILLEQIYRAFTIMNNRAYHK